MKCMNRKVLIGLVAIAGLLFFAAPSARGALPLLVALACPLSMVLMMGGAAKMMGGKTDDSKNSCATGGPTPQDTIAAKDAEIARLNSLLQQHPASKNN